MGGLERRQCLHGGMQWPGRRVQQLKTARRVQHLKNTFELAVCFKGSCAIPLHQDFKATSRPSANPQIRPCGGVFKTCDGACAHQTTPTFTSEGRMKTVATDLPFLVGA